MSVPARRGASRPNEDGAPEGRPSRVASYTGATKQVKQNSREAARWPAWTDAEAWALGPDATDPRVSHARQLVLAALARHGRALTSGEIINYVTGSRRISQAEREAALSTLVAEGLLRLRVQRPASTVQLAHRFYSLAATHAQKGGRA